MQVLSRQQVQQLSTPPARGLPCILVVWDMETQLQQVIPTMLWVQQVAADIMAVDAMLKTLRQVQVLEASADRDT